MSWVKRNLYFLIGTLVALGLMAAAFFYVYQKLQFDNQAREDLNKGYAELKRLYDAKPQPSEDNITEAKKQQEQLRGLVERARTHFEHIPAIPSRETISSQRFSADLRRTIERLQREAALASVTLPPKY